MCEGEVGESNRRIWKAKIPLKIKVFMWLINQNAILTKDNMLKRNWQGDQHCKFCSSEESINHLFFYCTLAKYVWSLTAWVIRADCRPNNIGQFCFGVRSTCQRTQSYIWLVLLRFARQSGKRATMFVLKEKRLGLLLRSYVQLHLFLDIGQVYKRKRKRICWKPELKRLRTRRWIIIHKSKIMENQDLGLCCSSKRRRLKK
jgi:hypothetical protein